MYSVAMERVVEWKRAFDWRIKYQNSNSDNVKGLSKNSNDYNCCYSFYDVIFNQSKNKHFLTQIYPLFIRFLRMRNTTGTPAKLVFKTRIQAADTFYGRSRDIATEQCDTTRISTVEACIYCSPLFCRN